MLRPRTHLVLLWLSVLAVFLPALAGGYVDDDLDLLPVSPIFAGLDRLSEAVRSPFWGEGLGYWRPLPSLLMALGHAIGDGHPWPTHAFALLAHLAAATLAFSILRRLDVAPRIAALAAAAFALHPCQVESVAWVAALGDPLAGAATLLAVDGWLAWRQRARAGWPWQAWIGVALALASKESGLFALGWLAAVDLAMGGRQKSPAIAPALQRMEPGSTAERWFGPQRERRHALAWLVVLALVACWLGLRVLVFGDWAAGFDRAPLATGATGVHALLLRAYLALGLLTLPTGWLGITPYRWVPPDPAGLLGQALPMLALAAGVALAWWSAARARPALARLAALGAGATVVPLALLPHGLGPWPLVDRYVYTLLFAWAAVLVGCGRCRVPLGLTLVLVSAGASAALVPRWRSQVDVVARALADCPRHPEPHFMLGNLERERGERTPARQTRERRAHFARAAAAFATALRRLEQPLYARVHLREVVGLNARLGGAVAAIAGRVRGLAEVRTDLAALATEFPDSSQVQLVLGAAHAEAGDFAAAEAAWQRALASDPGAHQAAFNLGRLYWQLGRLDQARAMLHRAVALNPRNDEARGLLATLAR